MSINNYFISLYETKFFGNDTCITLGTPSFGTESLKLYPNPASNDVINLEYSTTIGAVEVFDITGKSLISTTIAATTGQVDVSTLPSGTYFVKVLGTTQKLVR